MWRVCRFWEFGDDIVTAVSGIFQPGPAAPSVAPTVSAPIIITTPAGTTTTAVPNTLSPGVTAPLLTFNQQEADRLGRPLGEALDRGVDIRTQPGHQSHIHPDAVSNLNDNHGIDEQLASDRLHDLKDGIEGNPDTAISLSGDVWDVRSGEFLGSLTQGGASGR